MNKGKPAGRRRRAVWRGLFLLAAAWLAAGCAGGQADDPAAHGAGKLGVVTSFYPLYDFASKIGGEHAEVVNLVPAGVDSHDWSPRLQDMRRIAEADLFLYLGAGYEGWVDDFLGALEPGNGPAAVEASRGADLIRLSGNGTPLAAGGEHSRGHGPDAEHAADHGGETGYAGHEDGHAQEHGHDHGHRHGHSSLVTDPHVWLSPKQALVLADNIRRAFVEADPGHREDYERNHAELAGRLLELDARARQVAERAARKTFIVSHASFGYLARDYGLTQIAVMGLAPDAEPTAGWLREVREEAERLGIRYLLTEELVSPKVAQVLAESLGIGTLVLNPLEGLTEEQLAAGEDYFSVMERNLTTLAVALE